MLLAAVQRPFVNWPTALDRPVTTWLATLVSVDWTDEYQFVTVVARPSSVFLARVVTLSQAFAAIRGQLAEAGRDVAVDVVQRRDDRVVVAAQRVVRAGDQVVPRLLERGRQVPADLGGLRDQPAEDAPDLVHERGGDAGDVRPGAVDPVGDDGADPGQLRPEVGQRLLAAVDELVAEPGEEGADRVPGAREPVADAGADPLRHRLEAAERGLERVDDLVDQPGQPGRDRAPGEREALAQVRADPGRQVLDRGEAVAEPGRDLGDQPLDPALRGPPGGLHAVGDPRAQVRGDAADRGERLGDLLGYLLAEPGRGLGDRAERAVRGRP